MKDYVIIVAAGSGTRMKSAQPKQFLELSGKPILVHTIEKFHRFDPFMEIIVVLNIEYVQFWQDLSRTLGLSVPHRIVAGGSERFYSVKNAIESITEENGIVGIHDAVRPLVSLRTIESCYHVARSRSTAVPVIPVADSIRIVEGGNSTPADRNKFRIIQTPQCFELSILRKAYQQEYHPAFTDDASVVEASGEMIHLVEGNRENIKITTTDDLRMAEALISNNT
jgi:2-C-methyl-D-erythritol 4-phosphate cytidylyltransferase